MAKAKDETPARTVGDVRLAHDAPSACYFGYFADATEIQKRIPDAAVTAKIIEANGGSGGGATDNQAIREQVARELAFALLTE